jgi:hypothetical protein
MKNIEFIKGDFKFMRGVFGKFFQIFKAPRANEKYEN